MACSHNAAPSLSLPERSFQPDSLSALSSHVPATWLNMINCPSERRGSSPPTGGPQRTQAPLCPCANDARPHPTPRLPKNILRIKPFKPQIIRKALFLLGQRATSEHELMKATGRVFCPHVFCRNPAEKRDTLCSASELSAAIMVYTASPEPYPCAF